MFVDTCGDMWIESEDFCFDNEQDGAKFDLNWICRQSLLHLPMAFLQAFHLKCDLQMRSAYKYV